MAEQYLVPQFIDVEDKIMGPVTVRQFIILMVSAGLMFLCYKLADFTLFLIEAIIIALISALIAFYKVNGMPFHFFLLNFIQTLKKPKTRIWNKAFKPAKYKVKKVEKKEKKEEAVPFKELPPSKLSDLSLIVNTGGVYQGKDEMITEEDIEKMENI